MTDTVVVRDHIVKPTRLGGTGVDLNELLARDVHDPGSKVRAALVNATHQLDLGQLGLAVLLDDQPRRPVVGQLDRERWLPIAREHGPKLVN